MFSVLFYFLSYLEIPHNIICYPDLNEGRKRCINGKFQRKTQNKLHYVAELVTETGKNTQPGRSEILKKNEQKAVSNLQRQYPKTDPMPQE